MRVGLVSDTHGLFDPKLAALFAGCDLILHAGDVVKAAVLEALQRIAPLRAVRGNNDFSPPLDVLPETAVVPLGSLTALLIHDAGLHGRPSPILRRSLLHHRPQVLIHGHSHRPSHVLLDGVLYVNPGSAGPRRFSLPRAAAVLRVRGRTVRVEAFDLAGDRILELGEPFEVRL